MDLENALDAVCSRAPECPRQVLDAALALALEIVREGHEGCPVGTLLTLGGASDVLAHSRSLILDPLAGHDLRSRHIDGAHLRGTVKQLAHLDGAFVIDADGTVVSACRYLDVLSAGVELPMGLGSRHIAAAAISQRPGVVAIAASASGVVRVFCDGEIVAVVDDSN